MRDFNIDLLKYNTHQEIGRFYDHLSSFGFAPHILQPTRVTSTSATLIDNIFINNISLSSTGGNITASVSDHYFQFCQLGINNEKAPKSIKYARNYKKKLNEFKEELKTTNWNNELVHQNADDSTSTLLQIVENLLDTMAPIKKLKN